MAFHIFKIRTLIRISKFRVKPTSKPIPFYSYNYTVRISGSCYSTEIALPGTESESESNSKLGKTHIKNNKSLADYNSQIIKHGKEGNVREAEKVFAIIENKNVVSWTSMLTVYVQNGEIDKARKVFDEMPKRNIVSYNAMITAYCKSKSTVDLAFELFSGMHNRNAISYGSMISGFVRAGKIEEAAKLFSKTPRKFLDPVCSSALCRGYLNLGRIDEAYRVFYNMTDRDVISWSAMIDGFCKVGRLIEARGLFDMMPDKNIVTWTSMIDGYVKDGNFEEGFDLFMKMRREGNVDINSDSMAVIFGACGSFSKRKEGSQIHGLVSRIGLECDGFLGNSMVTMYGKLGDLDSASKIFHDLTKRDVVSWNSLISGYVQCGDIKKAFDFFEKMPRKNASSWTNMITRLFSKGHVEKAVQVFELMPEKDSEDAWAAVISGLVNVEIYEEAFRWFLRMLRRDDIRVNTHTFCRILNASAGLANINQGTQIHALVKKNNMESEIAVQNALVSMYLNCGHLSDAREIFTNMELPNIVSFNTMITGFGQNGFGNEANNLFNRISLEEFEPNEATFLGILSSCVNCGLVEEGLKFFETMKSLKSVEATLDHYSCIVDLLCRAGFLDEAIEFIDSMPFKPHSEVWESLLRASKTLSRFDIARLAAQKRNASELENDTEKYRKTLQTRKSPGCSWIVLKDRVDKFFVGDRSHVEIERIEATLKTIDFNSLTHTV